MTDILAPTPQQPMHPSSSAKLLVVLLILVCVSSFLVQHAHAAKVNHKAAKCSFVGRWGFVLSGQIVVGKEPVSRSAVGVMLLDKSGNVHGTTYGKTNGFVSIAFIVLND